MRDISKLFDLLKISYPSVNILISLQRYLKINQPCNHILKFTRDAPRIFVNITPSTKFPEPLMKLCVFVGLYSTDAGSQHVNSKYLTSISPNQVLTRTS